MAVYLPEESATKLAFSEGWTVDMHLLALQADLLAQANWQRSKDGEKNRRQPKQIPRPGVEDKSAKKVIKAESKMSLDEAEHWMKSRRA